MTSLAATAPIPLPAIPHPLRWLIALTAGIVSALILAALVRHVATGSPTLSARSIWLPIHLGAAIPIVPLGAWVLVRRKGDRLHRLLGRIWAALMMVVALSSFGLVGMLGHLGPIHILSLAVTVGIPRAVWLARAGQIRAHLRGMVIIYGSAVAAALFAFVPGRVLGAWLFG
ncbi:DUF2306 domain-containing protein [Sphingomonas sp. AP4-R1]|uniref:DUF2306 domain-containing protein n=1 Tax=Sphingomonas sp. AP4-R1 TaxID=2735134 RepID=UPI001493880B|nr:DUF2306 domain-containing protein [Sphingomonas sp. AP4-R1]QJU56736.1 DUF2306 domain-containing protein [Sphingomonas sp. AP4-R1]